MKTTVCSRYEVIKLMRPGNIWKVTDRPVKKIYFTSEEIGKYLWRQLKANGFPNFYYNKKWKYIWIR